MNRANSKYFELWENVLGEVRRKLGEKKDTEETVILAEDLLHIAEEFFHYDKSKQYTASFLLAKAYAQNGNDKPAEVFFDKSLELARELYGEESEQAAEVLREFANLRLKMGKTNEGILMMVQAANILKKLGKNQGTDYALLLQKIGDFYIKSKQYDYAERLLRNAAVIFSKNPDKNAPAALSALKSLGDLYFKKRDFAKAKQIYEKFVATANRIPDRDEVQLGEVMTNLGVIYMFTRQLDRAEQHLIEALTLFEMNLGTEDPKEISPLQNLGNLYIIQGKNKYAIPLYKRAKAIAEKYYSPSHPITLKLKSQIEKYLSEE